MYMSISYIVKACTKYIRFLSTLVFYYTMKDELEKIRTTNELDRDFDRNNRESNTLVNTSIYI